MLERAAGSVLNRRAPPAQERYEYLAAWVLPPAGGDHDNFRLEGEFTPTDAAPPVASPEPVPSDNLSPTRLHTGGQLVAPALELVATARQIGKLDELATRVKSAPSGIDRNQRGQLAMIALIGMAQGRPAEVKDALRRLHELSKALPGDTPPWLHSPEQVAHWATLGRPGIRVESQALGNLMFGQWHNMRGKAINPRGRDIGGGRSPTRGAGAFFSPCPSRSAT